MSSLEPNRVNDMTPVNIPRFIFDFYFSSIKTVQHYRKNTKAKSVGEKITGKATQ